MYGPLIFLIAYGVLSIAGLVALSAMILLIGRMLGDCPEASARAKAAAVTIATGFAAIGLGGIALGGAMVGLAGGSALAALAALGLIVLCLGLGFGHAIATLRMVISPQPVPAPALEELAEA